MVGGAALYIELRLDPGWLLANNLGLALYSAAVALLGFGLAPLWARRDQRG